MFERCAHILYFATSHAQHGTIKHSTQEVQLVKEKQSQIFAFDLADFYGSPFLPLNKKLKR